MCEQKIKSIETVLDDLRNEEKFLINQKREEELNKYVGDKDWYKKKNSKFTDDFTKDRLSKIKENQNYIKKLKSKDLY